MERSVGCVCAIKAGLSLKVKVAPRHSSERNGYNGSGAITAPLAFERGSDP